MIAYFVRGCEDNKYRIFKCDIEISTNFVNVKVDPPKFKFGQNDGVFRDCDFSIHFNFDSSSRFYTMFDAFHVHGLVNVNNKTYFNDAYSFYLNKDMGHDEDYPMGN